MQHLTLEYVRVVPQAVDTALHSAVWHNNLSQLSILLDAGAPVDVQDSENQWCATLYRGQAQSPSTAGPRCTRPCIWAIYAVRYASCKQTRPSPSRTVRYANAHCCILWCSDRQQQGRTPLDLASHELKSYLRSMHAGDVFSWGHGANYQLGTGATGVAVSPARVDAMATRVVAVGAGKFHSVAVAADGRLFTWGFGRGGRLGTFSPLHVVALRLSSLYHPLSTGHPDSCEGAVIHPRLVEGLGRRMVTAVAVAKHHTVVATDGGEVWSWGSNRDGRLGYPAVDTQTVPRRVSLKQRVVGVAAANKHTVVLTAGGAVFSWGANVDGQLGYGTSDSGCNPTPRVVESVKVRVNKRWPTHAVEKEGHRMPIV